MKGNLLIAALLHDIGKVMQRAGVERSEETRNIGQQSGPSWKGESTHLHVWWTLQFFQEVAPSWLASLTDCKSTFHDNRTDQIAFRHHNPGTPLHWLLAEADRQASGMDRGEERENREGAAKVPLQSLLSRMKRTQPENESYPAGAEYGIGVQDDDFACYFPKNIAPPRDLSVNYMELWKGFVRELREGGPPEDPLGFLDTLMRRYFWCVPASAIDKIPDTSLYDHSRAVAALALAKQAYHEDRKELEDAGAIKDRNQFVYRLVSGDLSGIQRYIFDISHGGKGGVAKALRARSLKVSLFTEIVAHQLLQKFELPTQCLLILAGGKFTLILPNVEKVIERLKDFEQKIALECMERFNGEIGINLASVPLCGNDLFDGKLSSKMEALQTALHRAKLRPLKGGLIAAGGKWSTDLFVRREWMKGGASICPSCHKVLMNSGCEVCDGCAEDRDLGRKLPHAEWIQTRKDTSGMHPFLGWSIDLGEGKPRKDTEVCITEWIGKSGRFKGIERSLGRHVPIFGREELCTSCREKGACEEWGKDDEAGDHRGPMYFRCIAQSSRGRPLLGFLKADVDSLGFLLKKGLPYRDRNLSRHATFSRQMDAFFCGRLEAILRKEFPMVYTVYAGGDDLLLVGPWDVLISLAQRLRIEFHLYTGGNKDLTLSCGIALCVSRYPVFRAVEEAEELLNRSKSHAEKDHCTVLGYSYAWDDLEHAMKKARQVEEWQRNGIFSTSFVRNLAYFARLYRQYKEEKIVSGLRYLPLLSYSINRNLAKPEDPDLEKRTARNWAESLTDNIDNNPDLKVLGFIADYSLKANQGGRKND